MWVYFSRLLKVRVNILYLFISFKIQKEMYYLRLKCEIIMQQRMLFSHLLQLGLLKALGKYKKSYFQKL